MQFPEPIRMAEDSHSPVWARSKRRSSGGGSGLVGVLVTLLALFGALTAVLGIKERSLAEGGAIVDGWIAAGVAQVKTATGQAVEKAPETAQAAADKAGAAAEKTGDALQAGAAETADQLKKQ